MRKELAILVLGSVAVLGVACHDVVQPAATTLHRTGSAGSPSALITSLVLPVERATPLAQDLSWSFIAGPNGGSSSNAATGLAISIPSGALADDVTITVTALAGSDVAYRFEPHGLLFSRSAYLTQDLTKTTADLLSGLTLSGAYFSTDTLELSSGGLALVSEVIGALVNPLTRTATFPIGHFSGYILASGRSDSTSTDGEQ